MRVSRRPHRRLVGSARPTPASHDNGCLPPIGARTNPREQLSSAYADARTSTRHRRAQLRDQGLGSLALALTPRPCPWRVSVMIRRHAAALDDSPALGEPIKHPLAEAFCAPGASDIPKLPGRSNERDCCDRRWISTIAVVHRGCCSTHSATRTSRQGPVIPSTSDAPKSASSREQGSPVPPIFTALGFASEP